MSVGRMMTTSLFEFAHSVLSVSIMLVNISKTRVVILLRKYKGYDLSYYVLKR